MIGLIASHTFVSDINEVFKKEDIWFKKIGEFDEEQFLQHCQAAVMSNVQILIIDMTCSDDESIIRGIQQYRLHKDTRIILLAPDREPGDQTISTLIGLQVLDIIVPIKNSDEEGYEPIQKQLQEQIQLKPSYKNIVSWDVRTSILAEKKRLEEQKKRMERNSKKADVSESSILDHIENVEITPPTVKEKLMYVHKTIGTIIISIVGVEPGVGVTHLSILMGNFLSKRGYNVAIVELNSNNDFTRIEASYEGEELQTRSFKLRDITYYKSDSHFEISELMEKKYDYILLDLGCFDVSDYTDEFFRSHLQVIVGHGSDWKQHKLIEFSENNNDRDQSNWLYCVPHVKPIFIKDIEKEMFEGRIFQIPTHPDPYEFKKTTDLILSDLLKEYIEKRKINPKSILKMLLAISIIIIMILIFLLITK